MAITYRDADGAVKRQPVASGYGSVRGGFSLCKPEKNLRTASFIMSRAVAVRSRAATAFLPLIKGSGSEISIS